MTLSNLDQVRLAVGDTDATDYLFTDDEVQQYLDNRSDNVYLAAADCADAASAKYARKFTFATDNQTFNLGEVTKAFESLAKRLRAKASGGVTNQALTKVDGYSQDIAADEATTSANVSTNGGRVRSGYFIDDRPY